MYAETIPDPVWKCLQGLNSIPSLLSAYLAGGTALALQIGHRKSNDLDFFVSEGFDIYLFKKDAARFYPDSQVINQTSRHTEFLIQSIKVDLLNEQIPLKFPLQSIFGRNKGLKMADPRDIGRMKLISIGSRGSKRDFVDLYCITRKIVSLDHLLKMVVEENQGIRYSKPLFLKGLVDFEEADREGPLEMIWDISWSDIKRSLIKEVKATAQTLRKK